MSALSLSASLKAINVPEKGLIMDLCWIQLVLSGAKTWEIRSTDASFRGRFGLCKKGRCLGSVELVAVHEVSRDDLEQQRDKHQVQDLRMFDSKPRLFAWELARPCKFTEAVQYDASRAGQRWISLQNTVLAKKTLPARTEDASRSSSGSGPKAVSHASCGSMLHCLRCLERREAAGEGLDQDSVESDLLSAGQASFRSVFSFSFVPKGLGFEAKGLGLRV